MNVKLQMNMFKEVKNVCYNLSTNETYCYVALRMILKNIDDYKIITLNDLTTATTNTYKPLNTHTRNNLIDGLNGLQNKELITYNVISKRKYKINVKNIMINDTLFFNVPSEYINLVSTQNNSFNLLGYYIFMLSTINIKTNLGYMSQNKITEYLNINRTTQTRNNNILISLGIFSIHSRSSVDMNGNFINATNVYCLPKYKDESLDNDINGLNKKIKNKNKKICLDKKKKEDIPLMSKKHHIQEVLEENENPFK